MALRKNGDPEKYAGQSWLLYLEHFILKEKDDKGACSLERPHACLLHHLRDIPIELTINIQYLVLSHDIVEIKYCKRSHSLTWDRLYWDINQGCGGTFLFPLSTVTSSGVPSVLSLVTLTS